MRHPYGHPAPAAVTLSGRALHTGVSSTVRIVRRDGDDDGAGLRFSFPGFPAPLAARDLATLGRAAHRATVLTHPSGAVVRTPEHLLAASLFFADAPLDITCDAAEIPGLDGSAAPWFDALAAASATAAPGTTGRCREYASGLTWTYTGREGRLEASPAPSFSVECVLTRGTVHQTFRLESIADAPVAVLPARTFIFWKDWNALRASSEHALLAGADEGSGLLLAESPEDFADARAMVPESAGNAFPLVHPRALRFPEEAARHKVLDLLGDLALASGAHGLALPRLRLAIVNGGHALNHLLLNELARDHRGRNPGATPP